MMKKLKYMTLAFVLLTFSLSACSEPAGKENIEKTSTSKIAYITGTGGLGDKSFNDLGYEGIKRLTEQGIQCDVAEPKAISEAEGILRSFAETGDYALIISMGVDSVDPISRVATDYPELNFMVIDGMVGMKNVKSFEIDQTETGFLAGVYAGMLEKEGKFPYSKGENIVGGVGGADIPLIRGILTGFECGVRYVNPEAKVLTSYVGAWNDPGKGSELAQGMYEQGADIVFQAAGASGMGVIEAAQKQNLYAIGYDGNQNVIAPENMLGSAVRGVGEIIEETAHEALEGTFEGGDFHVQMKDNPQASQMLLDGISTDIPESVIEKFESVKKMMEKESFDIPSEPGDIEEFLSRIGVFEG